MNKIHITEYHEGKMLGMQSLSTSCASNPICLKNHKITGSICEKCYAQTLLKMRPRLKTRLEENVSLLADRIVPWDELPWINANIFRFEAFGDLHNTVQLQNYVNMAKKNSHCRFALWTKNYDVAYDFFSQNPVPDNMNILLSSLMINVPVNTARFKALGIPVKTFTVYRLEYAEDNAVEINCGAKRCMECRLCYEKNDRNEIRELLKSDQAKKREVV